MIPLVRGFTHRNIFLLLPCLSQTLSCCSPATHHLSSVKPFDVPTAKTECALRQCILSLSCCFDALQELSDLHGSLNEAKKQITGFQNEQSYCLAKCESATQSAAEATAEMDTLKQELAEVSASARAMEADLASAQQVSCVA